MTYWVELISTIWGRCVDRVIGTTVIPGLNKTAIVFILNIAMRKQRTHDLLVAITHIFTED